MQQIKRWRETGLVWLWLTIAVLILDRVSKLLVIDHLTLFVPYKILPVFNLTLAYNTGAAFSFLDSADGWQNWLFGIIAIVISVIILRWLAHTSKKQIFLNIALTLILAGAIGNAIDRVLYQYVIDFLDFHGRYALCDF